MHLYRKPTLGKIQGALGQRLSPIEVMLCVLEEVQMFFLIDSTEDRQLKQP